MKVATLIILMITIVFSISLFWNTGTVDPTSSAITIPGIQNADLTAGSTNSSASGSILWNFITQPTRWSSTDSSSIFGWIVIVLIAFLGAASTFAGFFRVTTSDAISFIPLAVVFLGFGAPAVILLYSFIQTELSPIMCGGPEYCLVPTWISVLLAGSLGVQWLVANLKAWRTGFYE